MALREDKAAAEVHLDALQVAAPQSKDTRVAGMVISHPERLVYPTDQITKLEVARYYERVGDLMMPFVANRPLALLRAPDGITGQVFFQKSFANHLPAHVEQTRLDDGSTVCFIKNARGLVSLAQFGAAVARFPGCSPLARHGQNLRRQGPPHRACHQTQPPLGNHARFHQSCLAGCRRPQPEAIHPQFQQGTPPRMPQDWLKPMHQSVSKAILRMLNVEQP